MLNHQPHETTRTLALGRVGWGVRWSAVRSTLSRARQGTLPGWSAVATALRASSIAASALPTGLVLGAEVPSLSDGRTVQPLDGRTETRPGSYG